ncbi:RE1 [Symbiodinium sp. CCMP2592]|nr:RE1 [Symbiodinium sp. CCMP2592]
MDPILRRRAGKGQGSEESIAEPGQQQLVVSIEGAEVVRDVSREVELEAGPLQIGDGAEGAAEGHVTESVSEITAGAAETLGVQMNPFWSQKIQDEARLAAARPAHLDETASDSTEMRQLEETALPVPKSSPVSFGPSHVGSGIQGATSASSASVENQQAPGLRPGERRILTEMKDLMETIMKQNAELSEQNTGLRQRIDKLEEEKASSQQAWRSGFGVTSDRDAAVALGGIQWGDEVRHGEGDDLGRDPWEGQDVLNLPFPPGRDPFNPGDRTFWNLPTLEGVHLPSPATRAGDWLAQIRPLLCDLSEWSQLWWSRVEWEAQALYRQWSRAPAIQKGMIQPRLSVELTHVKLRRLESRAYGMLQSAVPQAIRDELLATRSLHCVGLLFQILKVYAPGGLQERAQVLTELTNLGHAKSASDVVNALRAWSRCHARAVSMGVMVPDPALILRGVDSLVDSLSRKAANAQVAFRLSVARNQLQIDHHPSMVSVIEYMRVLQSEWEQVSVSGQEATSGPPKVARMDTDQGNGGKDGAAHTGDKGDKGGKGAKGEGKKGEKGETAPKELETFQSDRMQQALALRALNLGARSDSVDFADCAWGSEKEVLEWLRGQFRDWPEHLLRRALPARCDSAPEGSHAFMSMNRRHRRAVERADTVVLHLFSGSEKGLQVEGLGSKTVILRVDERVKRDILDEKTYSWLASLCSSGKVSAVVACPPSNTFKPVWSDVEKDFKRLRGPTRDQRFGLLGNSQAEQEWADDQTVMLLRTLTLHHLAHEARAEGCMVAIQHPEGTGRVVSGPGEPEQVSCGWWHWPELDAEHLGWYRASYEVCSDHHRGRRAAKAILTNSWVLYTTLHARTEWREIQGDPSAQWQPSVLHAVGHAIQVWKKETVRDRDERLSEDQAALKALTKEEIEFREHCEKDHIIFRKDCKVCLQAAMRGPRHIRQKYQHSNALCLNLDLIGPWIPGRDHALSAPARHILVATLGVPVFRDGNPLPLQPEDKKEEKEGLREGEGSEDREEDDASKEAGGIGEWVIEDESEKECEGEEEPLSEEEYKRLCEEQDEKWRTIAQDLKDPVELHELTFAEPLVSKKVTVQSRAWSRKTPYAPRAVSGITLCPAANISGCTVVLIPGNDEEDAKFHVAPVMYRNVKDQVAFEAEEILDEPAPAPARRITGKRQPLVAHVSVGGESGLEKGSFDVGFEVGHGKKEANLLNAPLNSADFHDPGVAVPVIAPPSSATDAHDARLRPAGNADDADDARFRVFPVWGGPNREKADDARDAHSSNSESLGESYTLDQSEAVAAELLSRGNMIAREDVESLLSKSLFEWKPKTRQCDLQATEAKGWTLGSYAYGTQVGVNLKLLRDCEFPLPPHAGRNSYAAEDSPVAESGSRAENSPVAEKRPCAEDSQGGTSMFVERCLDEAELDQLLHEHVVLRKFLLEQHKHMQEEVTVAASQGWEALTRPLNDIHQWIEDAEHWLLWQDAEQLRKSGNVSSDEKVVLEARLKSLGVPSSPPYPVESDEQPWFGLYDEEDPSQGSGGVGNEKTRNYPHGEPVHPSAWEAEPAQPLQTITVSHQEVLRNLEDWKGSIGDELGNVFDVHQAMRRRSESELQAFKDAGEILEIIPSKALFQKKGGSGRHKCRVVACGNYAEGSKTKSRDRKLQCYAGGADSLSLRCHLRAAGHRAHTEAWRTSGADIRTAFLLAPLRQQNKRIILRPPTVLKQAGCVAEGEYWEITGALYGLQDSPADWAVYRDETLPTIPIVYNGQTTYLKQSKYDPNLWLLRCPESSKLIAALTIYVDDLLLSGTAEASEAVWSGIKAKWRISEPDYADQGHAITFCGFEIEQKSDGIHIGQSKYIQTLLDKYPEVQGTVSCPYAKENDNSDCKPQDSVEKLRNAQSIVGELLWVATRTRPDLVFGVSRIGQLVTRDVDQAIQRGEDMIRYLRATKDQELVYGLPGKGHGPGNQLPVERDFNLIEVFADASFCPGTDRSQTGIILMWGNAPVGWMSMRQPCASLSTAEAELQSSLDGMTLAEGLHGLLAELAEAPQQTFLYTDNVGACTVLTLPQGAWRTRHLRLKAAWFLEQLEYSKFRVYHAPGQFMLGDLCTKALVGPRVKELLKMMNVSVVPSSVDGGESHAVKKATKAESGVGSGNVISGGAEKALKAVTAASLLHGALSKLVKVQIELEPEERVQLEDNISVLKLACGALLLVGLTVLATWKCMQHIPRIRAVRESSDTSSEWSHVQSEPEGPDKDEDDDEDETGLVVSDIVGSGSRYLTSPEHPFFLRHAHLSMKKWHWQLLHESCHATAWGLVVLRNFALKYTANVHLGDGIATTTCFLLRAFTTHHIRAMFQLARLMELETQGGAAIRLYSATE